MNREEELRTAWSLWHILSDMTQHLWDSYEQDFLGFCIEEADFYSNPAEPGDDDGTKR
jgi:hypothetical protein